MRLPHEEEGRAVIRRELADELQVATNLLNLATVVFTSDRQLAHEAALDDRVKGLGLALLAKAAKQYRGVGELVTLGLGDIADGVTRMLYETMLAAHFLLLDNVRLEQNGKPLAPVPGKPLDRDLRVTMYLANGTFSAQKHYKSISDHPEMLSALGQQARQEVDQDALRWEADLGPEWTKRVRSQKFAGVSILDLARSLGFGQLHAAIYGPQSGSVHASDGLSHMAGDDLTGEIRFVVSVSTDDVAITLRHASTLLWKVLEVANDQLGLGLEKELSALLARISAMRLTTAADQ